MDSSSLFPPSFLSLSDDVIGSVVQRIGCDRQHYSGGRANVQVQRDFQSRLSRSKSKVSTTPLDPLEAVCVVDEGVSPRQYPTDADRTRSARATAKRGASGMYQHQNATNTDRRQRARLNQERYRKKLLEMPKLLEAENQQLKQQVQHLQSERDRLQNRGPPSKNVWIVATEYFRIFCRGFHAPVGTRILDIDFLNAAFAPDVDFGIGIGIEGLVRSWRTFTQYFPGIRVELKNLKQITEDSILATTTTSITISDVALSNAFPHLINGSKGGRCSRIVTKMKGQKLTLHGSVRFYWDGSTHRIAGVLSQADLLTPLLDLLGKPEDVALVFAYALVTPECNVAVCS